MSGGLKAWKSRLAQRSANSSLERFLASASRRLEWTWVRRRTARRRALPDFLIIGAQKCGTTSLYEYLTQHPSVLPALRKEIHFFNRPGNWRRGVNWYRAHFPLDRELRDGRVEGGRIRVTGEACPPYLLQPRVPQRVFDVVPQARLIAVLRNPVDRAYSHYQHNRKRGYEPLSFEEAIENEAERLAGELEREEEDPGYRSFALQRYSYLLRGVYVDQFTRWLGVFPREQFLLLSAEELRRDRAGPLRQVTDFLGLSELDLPEAGEHNVGGYSAKMAPKTRARLAEYFAPHNQRLYELLGVHLGWEAGEA